MYVHSDRGRRDVQHHGGFGSAETLQLNKIQGGPLLWGEGGHESPQLAHRAQEFKCVGTLRKHGRDAFPCGFAALSLGSGFLLERPQSLHNRLLCTGSSHLVAEL